LPIKRKICKIGTSFAVFLPKSWVSLLEEKHGRIEAVTMEVDGSLIVRPILTNVLKPEKPKQENADKAQYRET